MKILITGGASGLGEALTKRIASDSNKTVYFTYCHSEENATKLQSMYPNTFPLKCDFGNASDVEELTKKIGSIDPDALINNAYSGAFIRDYFHKTPEEDFLQDFRRNILPVIHISQSAINCFRKKKSGKIITVLTAALINKPPIGSSVYVAGKAYLHELTKSWAAENSKFNITSNTVSPAFMQTRLTEDVDERLVEKMKEDHPLKRLLLPDEVADAVSYLLNASSQVNGVNLIINSATDVI